MSDFVPTNGGRSKGDCRWKKFCEEFVRLGGTLDNFNGNLTEAARIAGYPTPVQAGHSVFKSKRVRAYISNLVETNIAKGDWHIPEPDEILAGLHKRATEGKNEIAQVKAWELIGKYRAMFTDKTELILPRRVVVEDEVGATAMGPEIHA